MMGVCITLLVSIICWPETASEGLGRALNESMDTSRALLNLSTRSFLLNHKTIALPKSVLEKAQAEVREAQKKLYNAYQEARYEVTYSMRNPADYKEVRAVISVLMRHLASMSVVVQNEKLLMLGHPDRDDTDLLSQHEESITSLINDDVGSDRDNQEDSDSEDKEGAFANEGQARRHSRMFSRSGGSGERLQQRSRADEVRRVRQLFLRAEKSTEEIMKARRQQAQQSASQLDRRGSMSAPSSPSGSHDRSAGSPNYLNGRRRSRLSLGAIFDRNNNSEGALEESINEERNYNTTRSLKSLFSAKSGTKFKSDHSSFRAGIQSTGVKADKGKGVRRNRSEGSLFGGSSAMAEFTSEVGPSNHSVPGYLAIPTEDKQYAPSVGRSLTEHQVQEAAMALRHQKRKQLKLEKNRAERAAKAEKTKAEKQEQADAEAAARAVPPKEVAFGDRKLFMSFLNIVRDPIQRLSDSCSRVMATMERELASGLNVESDRIERIKRRNAARAAVVRNVEAAAKSNSSKVSSRKGSMPPNDTSTEPAVAPTADPLQSTGGAHAPDDSWSHLRVKMGIKKPMPTQEEIEYAEALKAALDKGMRTTSGPRADTIHPRKLHRDPTRIATAGFDEDDNDLLMLPQGMSSVQYMLQELEQFDKAESTGLQEFVESHPTLEAGPREEIFLIFFFLFALREIAHELLRLGKYIEELEDREWKQMQEENRKKRKKRLWWPKVIGNFWRWISWGSFSQMKASEGYTSAVMASTKNMEQRELRSVQQERERVEAKAKTARLAAELAARAAAKAAAQKEKEYQRRRENEVRDPPPLRRSVTMSAVFHRGHDHQQRDVGERSHIQHPTMPPPASTHGVLRNWEPTRPPPNSNEGVRVERHPLSPDLDPPLASTHGILRNWEPARPPPNSSEGTRVGRHPLSPDLDPPLASTHDIPRIWEPARPPPNSNEGTRVGRHPLSPDLDLPPVSTHGILRNWEPARPPPNSNEGTRVGRHPLSPDLDPIQASAEVTERQLNSNYNTSNRAQQFTVVEIPGYDDLHHRGSVSHSRYSTAVSPKVPVIRRQDTAPPQASRQPQFAATLVTRELDTLPNSALAHTSDTSGSPFSLLPRSDGPPSVEGCDTEGEGISTAHTRRKDFFATFGRKHESKKPSDDFNLPALEKEHTVHQAIKEAETAEPLQRTLFINIPKPKSWRYRLWEGLQPFKSDEVKFGLKMAAALTFIGLWSWLDWDNRYLASDRGQWAMMTVMAVLSPTVGATFSVCAMRIIGTLIGSSWALLTYLAYPMNPYVILAMMTILAFTVAFLMLESKHPLMGVIMMLSYSSVTFISYLDDTDETIVHLFYKQAVTVIEGILIAVVMNSLLWPTLARRELRKEIAILIGRQGALFAELINNESQNANDPDRLAFQYVEHQLQTKLIKISQLLELSASEPRLKEKFPMKLYKQIVQCCQNILDRMVSMRMAAQLLSPEVRDLVTGPMNYYRRDMVGALLLYFSVLSSSLASKTPLPPYLPSARVARLKVIYNVRMAIAEHQAVTSQNHYTYIYYYAFSSALEEVIEELELLAILIKPIVGITLVTSGDPYAYGFQGNQINDQPEQYRMPQQTHHQQGPKTNGSGLVEPSTSMSEFSGANSGNRASGLNLGPGTLPPPRILIRQTTRDVHPDLILEHGGRQGGVIPPTALYPQTGTTSTEPFPLPSDKALAGSMGYIPGLDPTQKPFSTEMGSPSQKSRKLTMALPAPVISPFPITVPASPVIVMDESLLDSRHGQRFKDAILVAQEASGQQVIEVSTPVLQAAAAAVGHAPEMDIGSLQTRLSAGSPLISGNVLPSGTFSSLTGEDRRGCGSGWHKTRHRASIASGFTPASISTT
ncbi:hypothetical protein BG006_001075 [Podila minutissima]|uniref:Uncharacterized protein n=1 Tax=Podila minutissima TaxID=64525 RepID=A0A9P5STZ7_9FUNG|nr:hypothetical protein BG006_001075 [Podila minutissima]